MKKALAMKNIAPTIRNTLLSRFQRRMRPQMAVTVTANLSTRKNGVPASPRIRSHACRGPDCQERYLKY